MEWIRGQPLGHGTFAKVSLAKPKPTNSSRLPPLIAVKSCAANQSGSLVNEYVILDELKDCPDVITCYGDSFTVENGQKLYNVALEYAVGGSLSDKVKSSESLRLSEPDVRRYTKSVLKGLQFIHRKGFVHCDIKLQNILLFDGDNVKIADFGLSKKAADGFSTKYEVRGTPLYMAPETVSYGEQGPPADIWAVGCLVAEMITGKPVWSCSDIGSLLMKIGRGADVPEIPWELSDAGKDFLGKCFVKDASKRWTADMLLNHPFMDGEDQVTSISPRDPFDFPDWESEESVNVMPSFWSSELELELELEFESKSESDTWARVEMGVSPTSRLRQLVVIDEMEIFDWSGESSWITVR